MTEQPQDRTRDVARGLTDALNGLTARLAEVKEASEARDEALTRYGRRNRKLVVVDIIATVIATAATTLALLGLAKAHDASAAAAQVRRAAIVSCQSTNEARAQNGQLWVFLIGLSKPPPNATPAQVAQQRKLLALLRGRVKTTFKARDCEALARGERP